VLLYGDSWFWSPIPGVGNLADKFNDFGCGQAMSLVSIRASASSTRYRGASRDRHIAVASFRRVTATYDQYV